MVGLSPVCSNKSFFFFIGGPDNHAGCVCVVFRFFAALLASFCFFFFLQVFFLPQFLPPSDVKEVLCYFFLYIYTFEAFLLISFGFQNSLIIARGLYIANGFSL